MPFNDQIAEFLRASRPALAFILLLAGSFSSALAEVTVTKLANDGVLLSDGRTTIMIDGMVVEPYAIYGGLPEAFQPDYFAASGPFANVDMALASHRHHDHNQPSPACKFLQASAKTRFVSSTQVLDLLREKCRSLVTTDPRIRVIDPQYGIPEVIMVGDVRISVFPLSHGTGKYAKLQHFGHLVEFGEVTVLHVGDAAMDPTDYVRAGLDQMQIDVAIIPFWYFQPGPGAEVVNNYINADQKIALHIPPDEMKEVTDHLTIHFPEVEVLIQPMDQTRFSPPSRQSD